MLRSELQNLWNYFGREYNDPIKFYYANVINTYCGFIGNISFLIDLRFQDLKNSIETEISLDSVNWISGPVFTSVQDLEKFLHLLILNQGDDIEIRRLLRNYGC